MAGVMEMIKAAKAGIENLRPEEVAEELKNRDVLLVDIREPDETREGIIPGAVLAPRGMLEFHADPATTYHIDGFRTDRRVILYCAAGSRSALATTTLQEMGYADVAHLDGGFTVWKEAGRPVAAPAMGDPG